MKGSYNKGRSVTKHGRIAQQSAHAQESAHTPECKSFWISTALIQKILHLDSLDQNLLDSTVSDVEDNSYVRGNCGVAL
jgi:hypothetical protein